MEHNKTATVKDKAYKIIKDANKVVYIIGRVPTFIIDQYQDLGYVVILKANDQLNTLAS